jgi:hypothetical protein
MIAAVARTALKVIIEAGTTKVFASALDWPGWCRSARTEEAALDALAAYAPRFAPVAQRAGLAFPAGLADNVDIVERSLGDATTNFGAPSVIADVERAKITAARATRLSTVVQAAWAVLDDVIAATPAQLRKGPRGGGRDRDAIAEHLLGTDAMYARKIGVKLRQPAVGDTGAIGELRQTILAVIGAPSVGPTTEKGWPTAYAARRIAWHALDHAWEMQDRAA